MSIVSWTFVEVSYNSLHMSEVYFAYKGLDSQIECMGKASYVSHRRTIDGSGNIGGIV